MTYKEAASLIRQYGAQLTRIDDEYRVRFGNNPAADYFTDDLDDAVGTVMAEAKRVSGQH